MINRSSLLSDLQSVLRQLEADLIQRSTSTDVPEVGVWLQAEFAKASEAKRTAQNYTDWLDDYATQVAAGWVLSCVFVRFLEDNGLYETPLIAGPCGQTGNGNNVNDANHGNHKSHDSHKSHSPEATDNRLQRAKDERELFFRQHPGLTDRDYLLHVFHTYRDLKGGVVKEVFGGHNPVNELPNWLGPDAAGVLLKFFQQINPDTGDIRHDFTDATWDTRFLGDLYQDLSEAARKKYALLQTPEFVEEFILDRTLDPALDEFTLSPSPPSGGEGRGEGAAIESRFKMIDPACGSGHFLLGTFPRILDRWQRREPATNVRELVQRTLDSIHGVDVNPYAIAIARFRLLLAAMRACNVTRLMDAPAFRMNLVCGDSLLHVPLKSGGTKFTKGQLEFDAMVTDAGDEVNHAYQSEDLEMLKRLLKPGQYHAVVANPPYIVPRDRALNEQYRNRFDACHMKYSLAVPFMEQLFRLAVSEKASGGRQSPDCDTVREATSGRKNQGVDTPRSPNTGAGYTGQITANSFMKREFGKKLIETFFPTVDLTHVIDTSGAYIPGHGTPTVILFGRHRPPLASTLRTVMGIRGEPSTPDDPARGLVWSAIVAQMDQPGSQSEFVSVGDSPRELFHKHPWSIGGGGAAELKEQLDGDGQSTLGSLTDSIGFASFPGLDDAFIMDRSSLLRRGTPQDYVKLFVFGEVVRDYGVNVDLFGLAPYDRDFNAVSLNSSAGWGRHLWHYRACLGGVVSFGGKTRLELGDQWWGWYRWVPEKYRTPLSIVFAFVATHNHFVLDRGGKVFNRSAPVIKLPREASEDDHLALLGLLNSSIACFWMQQTMHNKGGPGGGSSKDEKWHDFFEFSGTRLNEFPVPVDALLLITKRLDEFSRQRRTHLPDALVRSSAITATIIESAKLDAIELLTQMISLQEELDWKCYHIYSLLEEDLTTETPPVIGVGQRAFEIVMARQMVAGKLQTKWFEWLHCQPMTELPSEWPDEYRRLVERRISLIENDPNIRLIEQPNSKRRWEMESWESQLERALRNWLLDRLESYFDFDGRMKDIHHGEHGEHGEDKKNSSTVKADRPSQCDSTSVNSVPSVVQNALTDIQLASIATLADVASKDADFMQVAELYRDDPAFSVLALVEELVTAESVPLLPVLRYKESGLRKRAEWEKTWELQRREDATSNQLAVVSRQLEQATDEGEKKRLNELIKELTVSIAVPPKYISADFLSTGGARYWSLRGKLDVPKERWVSFAGCEAEDGSTMIGWAGYDHLQQAQAISAWYVEIRDQQGGHADRRLVPLLACLLELLPWIKQWHNDPDNEYNMAMGDFFEGFIKEESRQLPRPAEAISETDTSDLFPDASNKTYGWSLAEIQAWKPSTRRPAKRVAKKAASKKAAKKRGKENDE